MRTNIDKIEYKLPFSKIQAAMYYFFRISDVEYKGIISKRLAY